MNSPSVPVRRVLVVFAMATFSALPAVAMAQEGPPPGEAPSVVDVPLERVVRAEFLRDPGADYIPTGSRALEPRATLPPGDWKVPELGARRPVYALLALEGREHLLVLDASEAEGFFDRCHFDANANRDLTDDAVLLLDQRRKEYGSAQSGPVDTTVRVDGADLPFRFTLYLSCREPWGEFARGADPADTLYLAVRSSGAYLARFELGGERYRLLLFDANANGRFDDTLPAFDPEDFGKHEAMRPACDRIYLTTAKAIRPTDGFVFGRGLVLDEMPLELAADFSAGRLRLERAEGATVPVEFAAETKRLTLLRENAADCMTIFPGSKKGRLPVGRYRIHEYVIEREGPDGETWRLSATATKGTPFVEVTSADGSDGEAAARFELGEPYAPIAWVDERTLRSAKEGDALQGSIQFGVIGAAGEALTGLTRIAGASRTIEMSTSSMGRPKEAAYKVVLADGNIVAKGTFRYG